MLSLIFNNRLIAGREDSMDDYKRVAGAFLIGGVMGACAALLYAPKSGRETRKDIAKTARKIKREAVPLVEDAIDSINDFTDEVKHKVTDILESGKELSDGAKREIVKNIEYSQKVMDKQKKRLIEAWKM
jgi:gas vesicle protein